jgi:hypothetical protein
MTIPMNSGSILIVEIRGACPAISLRGSGIAASIVSRIETRARFACSSAERMISCVTPVILMSICRAVIPSRVPATLKSMSPR